MPFEEIAAQVPGIVESPAKRRKVALGLIGLVLVVNGLFHAAVYNAWFGPFDVEPRSLDGLDSPPLRRWVRLVDGGRPLTYGDLEHTNFVEERIGRGRHETVATFFVLSGHSLLVRSSDAAGNKGLVGVLVTNDDHSELGQYGQVLLDLDADYGLVGWAVSILGLVVILFALDQIRRSYAKPREMPPPLS